MSIMVNFRRIKFSKYKSISCFLLNDALQVFLRSEINDNGQSVGSNILGFKIENFVVITFKLRNRSCDLKSDILLSL